MEHCNGKAEIGVWILRDYAMGKSGEVTKVFRKDVYWVRYKTECIHIGNSTKITRQSASFEKALVSLENANRPSIVAEV